MSARRGYCPPLAHNITSGCLPFGAIAIACYLKKHNIDCDVVSTGFPDAEELIADSLADCNFLGISSMTGPYLKYAISVARMAKDYKPNLPVVWGGPHATLMDEEILKRGLGNFVIRGVGEIGMLSLTAKSDLSSVCGLSYLSNGEIKRNAPAFDFDINEFPALDYSLIPHKFMYPLRDTFNYFSSRGCPFNCSYCVSSRIYHRKWHNKTEGNVIEELSRAYEQYKFKEVFFWDDNLFVDTQRLKRIIEKLNRANIGFKWRGFCRTDIFSRLKDDEIINLKERGLEWLSFGAESGSQDMLNRLNKGITVESIKEATIRLKKFGIAADFSFMGGMPGESESDFFKTVDLFNWVKTTNPALSIRLFKFVPYPEMPIITQHPEIKKYLPKNIFQWSDITYQNARFKWVSKKVNNILNVFSASTMYSERPERFSILTILYFIVQFRFRKKFFAFPIESNVVNRCYGIITAMRHRKFHRRLKGCLKL